MRPSTTMAMGRSTRWSTQSQTTSFGRWRSVRNSRPSICGKSVPVDERAPSPSGSAADNVLQPQDVNGYPDLNHPDVLRLLSTERFHGRDSNGHAVNGHAANGHYTNGHASNGYNGANRHAANGHYTNGHHSNGHAVYSHDDSNSYANGNGQLSSSETLDTVVRLRRPTLLQPLPAPSSHQAADLISLDNPNPLHAYSNGHASGHHHESPSSTPSPSQPILLLPREPSPLPAPPQQPAIPAQPMQDNNSSPQGPPQATTASSDEVAAGIPKPILVISLVSACLTMASCVFNTLLPIYMVTELKMNMRSMGMFEGFLEAFSYVVRMFSGVLSDMMTSRKGAITLGFAMGAMAKFGMSGAGTVSQLFASKAIDRLANGVQAAPRDALISDLAPAASRSACFGFAQSMRKWGSFLGAGMSYLLMRASGNNYQLIFLMAASLTVFSTLAFVILVPSHSRPLTPDQQKAEDERISYQKAQAQHKVDSDAAAAAGKASPDAPAPPPPSAKFEFGKLVKDAVSMGSDFYRMLGVISMYGLGHINESMLEARAIEVGFGKAESTLVVALLALTISVSAWPLGQLDDKHGPRVTFALGMTALILGNLVLMLSGTHPLAVFGSLFFLGIHWAVIQGPLLSVVVSLAPSHLRGTAFGIFYTVMAATTVVANSIFGTIWHTMGANAAFSLSACLMVMALIALPHLLPEKVSKGQHKQQHPQQQGQGASAPMPLKPAPA